MTTSSRTFSYAGTLKGVQPAERGSYRAGPQTVEQVAACSECGSLVLYTGREQHDTWHNLIEHNSENR